MRCHSYLHHLPWTTHSNKKGWLINQILWTLPSSWRSCWNLALTSRPTIMDIFNITDDDSTLEGEQAVFDKHDEDVSLPSVLIKASHCYASRSVLHPLSRKEQCMWTSATPGATLRLHSWAIRFPNSLNLERMMISVWGRSRNVSLIDYWKSSACLQPHGHVGMTDGKEMFDGNILCSFVYPHIIVEISRTLRSWCNYLQSALKEGSAKHVIEGLLEHNFESLKSHYDKSYLIHREASPLCDSSGNELRRLQDTPSFLESELSSSFTASILELKLDMNTVKMAEV